MSTSLEVSGLKQVAYGVCDEHYDMVGTALISTLRAMPGDSLTEHPEAARGFPPPAYTLNAGTMLRAAYTAPEQPD